MTRCVYKYPIVLAAEAFVELPFRAEILTAQLQRHELCLWALVDPDEPMRRRFLTIVGTGSPVEGDVRYISTFQMNGGEYVFHVFERIQ